MSPTPSSSGDAGTPRHPPPVPSSAAASGRWRRSKSESRDIESSQDEVNRDSSGVCNYHQVLSECHLQHTQQEDLQLLPLSLFRVGHSFRCWSGLLSR
ncbi:uncharacterized protein LOC110904164 isoform X3 [Helianthus annuus]|uniref:uncharacterized protein LOC110904164 isoform X3 n=1 Tax=Helianthus annuus TaxID=4232 RepID=UPI001652C08A|nr:uncharacterized protein LOC110904164 isoform X3 [Helianthus annuus]